MTVESGDIFEFPLAQIAFDRSDDRCGGGDSDGGAAGDSRRC